MTNMRLSFFVALVLAASLGSARAVAGQQPSTAPAGPDPLAALSPEERTAHQDLTAFRIGIQNAFNTMGASRKREDMAKLLDFAHPDIIFTDMTGESLRGREAIMRYFEREMIDEGHSLTRMHSVFEADHLSIMLRPDVATNRGTGRGTFLFTDGKELTVDTRWTATLVKQDGRWLIAAFQFAPSIFDNPVTRAYRAWIYKAAAIAALVGLLIGLLIGRRMRQPLAA